MANGFGQQLLGEFRAGRALGGDVRGIARTGFTPQEQIAEATRKRQAFQDQATEENRSRFLEEANLRSVGIAALQLSNITDPRQQDEFARRKIAELELTGGRGVTDLREFIETPDELRPQALMGAIQIARDAGALERAPRPMQRPTPAALRTFPGISQTTGKPTTFQFNPETGETTDLEIAPIPRQKRPIETIEVGPEGTRITRGGVEAPSVFADPDAKGARKQVLKDLADNDVILSQMAGIAGTFDPELMTVEARLFNKFLVAKDKSTTLQALFGTLTAEDRAKLQARTDFEGRVRRVFNAYRKQITGAAASEKEMASLMESMFNQQQGPVAFQASFNSLLSEIQRSQRLRRRIIREGRHGTAFDKKDSRAGARLDVLMATEQDDTLDADQVAQELLDQDFTMEQVGTILESEGY